MLSKYQQLIHDLETTNSGTITTGGSSMTPIFPGNQKVKMTYQKQEVYEVGDIVFCSVRGKWIDAHLITAKGDKGYLISNNHNYNNGWTRRVYGKVIKAEYGTTTKTF